MKTLLFLLILLLAATVAVGFQRNWFSLSTTKEEQRVHMTVTVDQDKVEEDRAKAKEKLEAVGRSLKDKVKEVTTHHQGQAEDGAVKEGNPLEQRKAYQQRVEATLIEIENRI